MNMINKICNCKGGAIAIKLVESDHEEEINPLIDKRNLNLFFDIWKCEKCQGLVFDPDEAFSSFVEFGDRRKTEQFRVKYLPGIKELWQHVGI